MRLLGAAERGMDLMVKRATQRKAFGKTLSQQGSFAHMLAKVCSYSYRFLYLSSTLAQQAVFKLEVPELLSPVLGAHPGFREYHHVDIVSKRRKIS